MCWSLAAASPAARRARSGTIQRCGNPTWAPTDARSNAALAAVDLKNGSGDERCQLAHRKQDNACNVVRRSNAAERQTFDELIETLAIAACPQLRHPGGLDQGRRNCDHANTIPTQLDRETLRHRDEALFRDT